MNPRILGRSRLTDRLAEAAAHRVTLIVAPAGYGKSVALDHYLTRSDPRCARLDVASAQQTVAEFVRDLNATLGDADCGTVVIDGLQAIQNDPAAVEYLVGSVERTKGRVAWILASRSTIGLPVGTWIAYDDCELIIGADDLRFTTQELAEAALQLGRSADADEIDDVLRFTEGWPAAVSVALRTGLRSQDRSKRCSVIRETSQRLWAEQVYPEFSDDDRALLAVAAVLPEIDVRLLGLAGFANALEIIESIRERTAVLEAVADGVYRCSSLFREFLLRQTELLGKDAQQAAFIRAARALETDGDIESALDAYVTACSRSDVARLLESHGFGLLERGRGDAAGRAIESLSETTKRSSPRILALRGVLQSLTGNPVRAEALLRRSLARAKGDRDLVGFARLRLAPLIANYGSDVVEILDPIADDKSQGAAVRAEALSLRATARAIAGQESHARSDASQAEAMLVDIDLDSTRAKVLQRIGVAAMYVREADKARQSLSQAADLANELKLHSIASRSWSALSNLMCHEYDDVMAQLWYAEKAVAAATYSGDTLELQTALIQVAAAEMRRGNAEESEAIENQLVSIKSDPNRAYLLVTFKALRLAWDGLFAEAYRQLAPCWNQFYYDFDRVSCGAQCALFLALDGRREASVHLVAEVSAFAYTARIHGLFCERYVALSLLLCSVAESINGRSTSANRIVRKIKYRTSDPVIQLARRIASDFVGSTHRLGSRIELGPALEQLARYGYADVARLLQAVCTALEAASTNAVFGDLTPAELAVLRLLGEGLSNKEIALRSGRSINTVRAHLVNAIGKLKCQGRSQAVIVARQLGIIS